MPFDARIDAYIRKAAPSVQPVLKEIRAAIHAGCPDVVETIKWRSPTFDYKGIMAGMATFRHYTTMMFWKARLMEPRLSAADRKALKQASELKHGESLPGRAALVRLVKVAAGLNEAGVTLKRTIRKKPPVKTPPFLAAALKRNATAQANFDAFSPSNRREYIEWLADARQDLTRQRRLEQAVNWISEGKSRNWKYER